MMIEKKFGIEECKYMGFTQGQYWNGWECPYFTLEVAQQVAKDFSVFDDKLIYDEKSDSFIYSTEDYPEGEFDTFSPVIIDGKKLYPIGAFSWCWEAE